MEGLIMDVSLLGCHLFSLIFLIIWNAEMAGRFDSIGLFRQLAEKRYGISCFVSTISHFNFMPGCQKYTVSAGDLRFRSEALFLFG